MSNKTINTAIKELKASPLFAMSLASNELAHSNYWKWLIDLKDDSGKHPFIEVFKPGFYKDMNKFIKAEREKKNMDLYISYHDKSGEKKHIIIENKIKSIPTTDQLLKYQGTANNSKEFTEGILTGLRDNKSINLGRGELKDWSFLSYKDISTRITKVLETNKNLTKCEFIDQYTRDLKNLYTIFEAELASSKGNYVYECKKLDDIKLTALYTKLKGNDFLNILLDRIHGEYKDELNVDYEDWEGPISDLSYHNTNATLTIVYRQVKLDDANTMSNNLSEASEYGRIGVQIQGGQFRLYGGSSALGGQKEMKVFSILNNVEYLSKNKEEFIKKLAEDGKTTGMRNDYCKYTGAKYAHLYQHYRIENGTDYEALINEVVEQLKLAKRAILEHNLTFKN